MEWNLWGQEDSIYPAVGDPRVGSENIIPYCDFNSDIFQKIVTLRSIIY